LRPATPLAYRAYRIATRLIGPLAPALLAWRRRRGKEDPSREDERLGYPTLNRPEGRIAWLHGASVGEGLALLPLVGKLIGRGFTVLVTTGTVASATILAERLPAGALHQYIPLDVPAFLGRFLDHWQPDLVLIAESELWPNMLEDVSARGIPLALVNARLSERSFQRWQRFPTLIAAMLGRIDLCLAQSEDDGSRLLRLGAPHVQVAGNLKYDVPAPPVDPLCLAELAAAIGSRPVWLAASTHGGEDEIVAQVHQALVPAFPDLLTILVPRHAHRGAQIAQSIGAMGLRTALRSRGNPVSADIGLYIADTMGELGVFYRLANIVFVGKSIGGAAGGQNPIEPAKLGAAILHGPNVSNFSDVYRALDDSHGAALVGDAPTLARALQMLFSDPALLRRMARAASDSVEKLGGASDNILRALEPCLQMQVEQS
jgi:3-deoxy-D-manno-octulosonic-acid transferase